MITGLAHACFTVSSLKKSEDFYCGGLGLKRAFDFKNDQGQRTGVYLHLGHRTFIELFEGTVGAPAAKPSYRHICLEVDDMEATVKAMRARGVEVSDIKLGMDQSHQAWLTDPDGNRIELHGYTPKSWQAPFLA
jgi:catechol 2,3-dioxygenase-like lactoylglutathione lyase family enzyme